MPKTEGLTDKQRRFYVYVIAVNNRVAYVGKGCGNRMNIHLKRSHNPVLREIVEFAKHQGDKVRARRITGLLHEHEALRIERTLICRHQSRLANASLGSIPNHVKMAVRCIIALRRIKPKEQFLREPCRFGYSQEKRAELYDKVRGEYENLLALTQTHPHWFGQRGSIVITVGAHV